VNLLREVEKFLRWSDTAPTRFGREAVGDPRLSSTCATGATRGRRRLRACAHIWRRRRN